MLVLNVSEQISNNDCELYIQLFFEKQDEDQSIQLLHSSTELQQYCLVEQELCIFADEFVQIDFVPNDDFYIITLDAMHLFNSTCSFKEQFKFNIRIIRFNMYLIKATKRNNA